MSETAQVLDASETAVGGVPSTAIEAPKPAARLGWLRRAKKPAGPTYSASASRRRSINPRRAQFSLLVVRGDGVRIVRFNFARALALAGVILLAGAASFVGALLHDWLHLRYLTRESRTFAAQIAEQRKTIEDFNRRMSALRREVGAWRDLHARIQEPFGPEAGRANSDRGIGGATNRSEPFVSGTSVSEELNGLTATIMEEGENLRALDRLMQRASKALVALPSRWPVRGRVNSEFGNRKSPWTDDNEFHAGIDIGANRGTAVQAPAAGTVVFAGTAPEYGSTVIVDHGQEIKSLYGHLSQINVKQGQKVERGTLLAYTGNTGRSSGPHLHYEILVKGHPVNPRAYLWD